VSSRSPLLRAAARAVIAASLLAASAGCAASRSEIHLAPFYSRHSTAHGTRETEVLGGFLHSVYATETNTRLAASMRPLAGWRNMGGGDWHADILVPFGVAERREGETFSFVIPLYLYRSGELLDGTRESRVAMLPGFLMRNNSERGFRFGWFPFYGKLERFLTHRDVVFVLWPLYVSGESDGREWTYFVWPLLGWTHGGGERSFRFLPFYSHTTLEGRFDRVAVLWPFFQYHRNHLGGGTEEPETVLWIWPLYGRTAQGTYRAHTVLWPFFAYASDPRGDFRAFDAPWPLVRFQSGGLNTSVVSRKRIWPFFGYVEADRMVYHHYLWPLIHRRTETYVDSERESLYVLPFWQSFDRVEHASGRKNAWRKLWPLYQWEREDTLVRGSFPSLDPLPPNHLITYYYGWTWRLWAYERDPVAELYRGRAWLDLYRSECDAGEDRRSLSFLWSRRSYVDAEGRATRETSLLLGLLRWRKIAGSGFDMLSPAFPGPGWPETRVAASEEEP
jgi:hypothetical protein